MSDLDLLIEVAREAGELALDHAARPPEVTQKPGGAGPVTQADLAVDALLHNRLMSRRSGYGWLSEETPDDHARLNCTRVFIVDPIDGTRAFIEKSKDWAHAIAVVEAGQVVAGVVYLPARNALYAAAAGQGATLNGHPLAVRPAKPLAEAEVLTTKPNLKPERWQGGRVPFSPKYRSSLAWRLCLVAEGRFDAMLTLSPAWEWDIAAGALIAAEAGAKVTDKNGRALTFNRRRAKADSVITAAPNLHRQIKGALA